MRWLLPLLLLLAFPALADMYPDASNAKLPDARTNLAIAPHVATKTLLAAASTAAYPSGVWRDDYSAGLGAPPLFYQPGSSACSISGGDGGSQVASADGKCWLARFPSAGADLREWGAKIDGSTDDSTADLAAIAWANADNGALSFPPTGGISVISQTLAITASGVSVRCPIGLPVHSDLNFSSTGDPGCWFKWNGASGQPYMMTIIAPSGSTTNGRLHGIKLDNIAFDGNAGLAKGALQVVSIVSSQIRALGLSFDGGEIFSFDVVHRTATNFGENCDSQFNDILIETSNYNRTSRQVGAHAWVNPTTPNSGCNVSVNNMNITMNFASSAGFLDDGSDNNTITLRGFTTDATQACVDLSIRNDSGNMYPTNAEHFIAYGCNGKFIARGTTSFPSCTLTTCVQNNTIDFLDSGNGTPWPISEPGTSMAGVTGSGVSWRSAAGKSSPLLSVQGYLTGGSPVGYDIRMSANQAKIGAPGTCTGLGTGGTCALAGASTDSNGVIVLNTGSAATAATGQVEVDFYAGMAFATNYVTCLGVMTGYGAGWTVPFGVQMATPQLNKAVFGWTNSGNLALNTSYAISYHCFGT